MNDLGIFRGKKKIKKGKKHEYWRAAWMIEGKVRNVYLGSCKKLSRGVALSRVGRGGAGIEKPFRKRQAFPECQVVTDHSAGHRRETYQARPRMVLPQQELPVTYAAKNMLRT